MVTYVTPMTSRKLEKPVMLSTPQICNGEEVSENPTRPAALLDANAHRFTLHALRLTRT